MATLRAACPELLRMEHCQRSGAPRGQRPKGLQECRGNVQVYSNLDGEKRRSRPVRPMPCGYSRDKNRISGSQFSLVLCRIVPCAPSYYLQLCSSGIDLLHNRSNSASDAPSGPSTTAIARGDEADLLVRSIATHEATMVRRSRSNCRFCRFLCRKFKITYCNFSEFLKDEMYIYSTPAPLPLLWTEIYLVQKRPAMSGSLTQ